MGALGGGTVLRQSWTALMSDLKDLPGKPPILKLKLRLRNFVCSNKTMIRMENVNEV